jgi:biopolymer transport protein ExbB
VRTLRACRAALVGTVAAVSLGLAVTVSAQQQPAQPQQPPAQPAAPQGGVQLGELARAVQRLRADEARTSQEREQRFRAALQKQEREAQEALQRRNAAEARSNALDRQWNNNEQRIAELQMLLSQHQGNLGELFGVTRQVAGDSATVLQQSMLSSQYGEPSEGEERAEFMRRLAGSKALPSITELERLWYELMREMTDAGKVVKFRAAVLKHDETKEEMDVVRVGPFTASTNGEYLAYLPSQKLLAELNGELPGQYRSVGAALQKAPAGSYTSAVVDPASGALLGLYVERPNVIQRIQQGEVVVYVIVVVGIIGVLVALFQAVYLILTRLAVRAQLKNLDNPRNNNPLGRVLLSFRGDGKKRVENYELAELRISEAVLREVPRLERFQSFLRLAVAAGPLLGLIGTVIGMIITFRAIVASGTSDPKLMAAGIGQAMIATVMGLGIAIPLLFINAGLTTLSRGVTQTLDEQSQALLAESIGNRKA